jgi:hypothetical protein
VKRFVQLSLLLILFATPAFAHSVTLSWQASMTKGVKYQIYRNKKVVGTTKALGWTDNTVSGGATYSYSVFAVCASCTAPTHGKSIRSNTVTITIPPP